MVEHNTIRCPDCGAVFRLDKDVHDGIVRQIRDAAFEKELARRTADAVKLALAEAAGKFADDKAESDRKIAAMEAELAAAKDRLDMAARVAAAEKQAEADKAMAAKDSVIAELKAKLQAAESGRELAVHTAVSERDGRIQVLESDLKSARMEADLEMRHVREAYEARLRGKDEEIAFYRDFKAKQSTKMIGESLEAHCLAVFDQARAVGFPRAYFEKDNRLSETGSKGDFIYRDYDADGNEIVSVMLEMKNEADGTERKHKNADFFKELDKDRREKGCEYAILVSLLEPDSELYNAGIVDVSHRYPKMYVIRPQFLIPMLTLLRNAGLNCSGLRGELARIQEQNIDVTNFESQLSAFKDQFGRNYRIASEKFGTAIGEIDKAIDHLNKIKAALTGSERQLELASRKAEDLTVARLTRGNRTMKAKFDEARALADSC